MTVYTTDEFADTVLENMVAAEGGATVAYVAWRFDCSKEEAETTLEKLEERGFVSYIGKREYWVVTGDGDAYVDGNE